MQGRKTLHDSEQTVTEQKLSVVYNFYEKHDTYRHEDFDNFVYYGNKPKKTIKISYHNIRCAPLSSSTNIVMSLFSDLEMSLFTA